MSWDNIVPTPHVTFLYFVCVLPEFITDDRKFSYALVPGDQLPRPRSCPSSSQMGETLMTQFHILSWELRIKGFASAFFEFVFLKCRSQ